MDIFKGCCVWIDNLAVRVERTGLGFWARINVWTLVFAELSTLRARIWEKWAETVRRDLVAFRINWNCLNILGWECFRCVGFWVSFWFWAGIKVWSIVTNGLLDSATQMLGSNPPSQCLSYENNLWYPHSLWEHLFLQSLPFFNETVIWHLYKFSWFRWNSMCSYNIEMLLLCSMLQVIQIFFCGYNKSSTFSEVSDCRSASCSLAVP